MNCNPISWNGLPADVSNKPIKMNKPLHKNTLTQNSFTNFAYNGMKLDNDVSGNGNSYDFGARMYNSRLGRWFSLDPAMKKYTSLSPFGYTANNPILYVEIDGAIFDLGNLSEDQKKNYKTQIEYLSASKLFKAYYEVLDKSNNVYIIKEDKSLGKGGGFNPNNDILTLSDLDRTGTLAQELFHAFQSELGVYTPMKDASAKEAEGDLMTEYISNEVTLSTGNLIEQQGKEGGWAEDILKINGDRYVNPTNEQVQSETYTNKFILAANKRVDYWREKDAKGEYNGNGSYTTSNSCIEPKAIKTVFKMVEESSKVENKEKK